MDRSRNLAIDCAQFLVEHDLCSRLPQPLCTVASVLLENGVVQSMAHAYEALEYLSITLPSSFVLDDESHSKFLTFYDPLFLQTWTRAYSHGYAQSHGSSSVWNSHIVEAEIISEHQSDADALTQELEKKPFLGSLATELSFILDGPTALVQNNATKAIAASGAANFILLSDGIEPSNHKIYFQPVVSAFTDESLGDCSYLDTCYKGRGCKYVHYKVHTPPSRKLLRFSPENARTTPLLEPQYIQADIKKVDFSRLGSDYAAILIDPPWDIHVNTSGSASAAVSDADVQKLEIGKLQREGVVFLWVTGRALDVGRQCLKEWGYGQIEELVWCKTNQLGRTICTGRTGHWLNHTKEHCLIGVKGDPQWLNRQIDVDVLVSTTRGRSQKPDELYGIIDRIVGHNAKKIELFGRPSNVRPGWLTIGNEIEGTCLLDPEIKENWFHCK